MRIRYLLDENLDPRFLRTLQRHYPQIDVLRVGDASAPELGVSDPAILAYAEANHWVLVTDNRTSMPGHVEAYWLAGRHHWASSLLPRMRRTSDLPTRFLSTGMLQSWKSGWIKLSGLLSDTHAQQPHY